MNAKLTLKFNEYTETWTGALKECYLQGLEKSIVDELELNDENFIKYSMELAMATLVIGMRIWMKSKITADVKEMVREAVLESFYREIFNNNEDDFIANCKKFFKERYTFFYELCPNMDGKEKKKQRLEMIGMARYICAQVSDKNEEQNTALFEKLGIVFIRILTLSQILTKNSSLDIQFPLGKPKFIVQK
jgi:uncharacterized protein YuzE